MIFENTLDPVLLEVGSLAIRWYGLFFALGIVVAYLFLQWVFRREKYPLEHLDSLAVYLFIGVVVGARLGHIVFYNLDYFLANPLEILMIWRGGLASHGAAIGLFVAYLIWIRIHKVKFTAYADALVLAVPITATFVRIGNFFNSEIIGTPTNGQWGVIFRRLGEDFPRHPVQLYEAMGTILVFLILFLMYKKDFKNRRPLFFFFSVLFLYFSMRFIAEFFKARHILPDFPLSMGQILSIVPIAAAVVFFLWILPLERRMRTKK